MGVQLLRSEAPEPITLDESGLRALDAISVPVGLFDPSDFTIVWMNGAMRDGFSAADFDTWREACAEVERADAGPLKTMLGATRTVLVEGGTVDMYIPKRLAIPYIRREMPFSWTLHCRSVLLERDDRPRRLVTLQAPSLVEPPKHRREDSETAMDEVISLIDRAIDSAGGQSRAFEDLRKRVLDGRMDEPIFRGQSIGRTMSMSWNRSAALAMMLGMPTCEDGRS